MTTPAKPTDTAPIVLRQAKLISALQLSGLDCVVLNAGPSLIYLTGLNFHLSERPVLVFFTPGNEPMIVLPELEKEKLNGLPYEIKPFLYGEDPSTWGISFLKAIQAGKLEGKRIGLEPRQLRLLEFNFLSQAAPKAEFISVGEVVAKLRMYKDDNEINAMRMAALIAEKALTATIPFIGPGQTEKELATELTLQLFRAGCDPQIPFAPIVSSGPDSANPHATPSDRKIAPGDLLVVDWGAGYNGYISDITRTFAIGKVDTEYMAIGKIVLEANSAARSSVKPGITADATDHAARKLIEAAGYGKYFTHRTGHGLGMEGHEEPYIRSGNPLLLEKGMTFTIEPGIYLPGRNGVRIEDDVVVTDAGVECLTSLPREIVQLL